jgi:competence protein ComEC
LILLVLGLAWLAGIYLSPSFSLTWELLLFPGLGSLVVAAFYWNRPSYWLPALAVLSLTLGLLRYNLAVGSTAPGFLETYVGRGDVTLRGLVVNEPVEGPKSSLRVSINEVKTAESWTPLSGQAVVYPGGYVGARYGDLLEITGKLEQPGGDQGSDYANYLARQGVEAVVWYPRLKVVASNQAGPIYGPIYALRGRVEEVLKASLPDPEASVLVGLLTGKRSSIPASLTAAFASTGTSHILAISGWNITIVGGVLLLAGRRFLGRRAIFVAILGLILYSVFVGGSPSVVRAAVMGLLYFVATLYGRRADALTSLLLAGALMSLWDPFVLWDVGFQLSFLATLGLIVLVPTLDRLLVRLPRFLAESLSVTLAAQLLTMPLIAVYFSQVSLVAPLANFLVLPALPTVMLLGALTALAGLAFPPLGVAIGWLTWLVVTYVARTVELASQLPAATLSLEAVPLPAIWVYYFVLALVLIGLNWRPARGFFRQSAVRLGLP